MDYAIVGLTGVIGILVGAQIGRWQGAREGKSAQEHYEGRAWERWSAIYEGVMKGRSLARPASDIPVLPPSRIPLFEESEEEEHPAIPGHIGVEDLRKDEMLSGEDWIKGL